MAQFWSGITRALKNILEKHLFPWLLAEPTAVIICQFSGCKCVESQTSQCRGALQGLWHEAHTWCCSQVSTMLPAHWHLSNRHEPSIRRFQLLVSQSLCVNIYRSVYCCSMKGLQLTTDSSRASSQPSTEAFEHYLKHYSWWHFLSANLIPAHSCAAAGEAHFAFSPSCHAEQLDTTFFSPVSHMESSPVLLVERDI